MDLHENTAALPMPPKPFGLSFGGVALRKKEPTRFIDILLLDPKNLNPKSPDDIMRFIDAARMYKPTETECSELNISDDRLNVHLVQNILYLCGGCFGLRFETDELKMLTQLSSSATKAFSELESHFISLSSVQKKKKLNSVVALNGNVPKTADVVVGAEMTTVEKQLEAVKLSETTIAEDKNHLPVLVAPPLPPVQSPDSDELAVIKFSELAHQYLSLLSTIQSFVKQHQKDIVRSVEGLKIDPDPESKCGRKQPDWLALLTLKFNSVRARLLNNAGKTIGPISVGKLACLVSCCIAGQIDCTEEENSAIIELIEASNDEYSSHQQNCHTAEGDIVFRSQKYWAKRIFDFISTVSELKSMIKEEKCKYQFELFTAESSLN